MNTSDRIQPRQLACVVSMNNQTPSCYLWIAVICVGCFGFGRPSLGDEKTKPSWTADVEAWIQGLDDSSFRIRRESFLKLCDRSIPIDDWLAKETKSEDKHRSAVATWLNRLRRSSGTLAERAEILQDYEAMKNLDGSVIDRYLSKGDWDRILDLLSMLDVQTRSEFLSRDGQIDNIIDMAWLAEKESYIPRVLDLVLKPTQRVQANRWWRKLGLPDEWKVSENSTLPSVRIAQLEADGKIDEAIALAKKSAMFNFVEPLIFRANRWDAWFEMDLRRTPVGGLEIMDHQKAAMQLLLGQENEAEALFDKILAKRGDNNLSNGEAILSLALGRMDLFEKHLASQPPLTAFLLRNNLGDVHGAFAQAGLNDLSPESVQTWLDSEGYAPRMEIEDADGPGTSKAEALIRYADLFFQLGLREQGEMIDKKIVSQVSQEELRDGISAWNETLRRWIVMNEREKAIKQFKDLLANEDRKPAKKNRTKPEYGATKPESDRVELFRTVYPDFGRLSALIFDHLLTVAILDATESDPLDGRKQRIAIAIDQLEDLYAGRQPKRLPDGEWLSELRDAVMSKANEVEVSEESYIGFASVLDCLGSTQFALDVLEQSVPSLLIDREKAKYLEKLGQLDAASDLLVSKFRLSPSNIGLFVDCAKLLESVGRYGELDRYRAQFLSGVLPDRPSELDEPTNKLPTRPEILWKMEQRWLQSLPLPLGDLDALSGVGHQYGELAKTDLSQAPKAADYVRIEALLCIKATWADPKRSLLFPLILFVQGNKSHGFQSLILGAIADGNRELADSLFRIAHRCMPKEIEMPIVAVPIAERVFGKEFADEWFDLYYKPYMVHLKEFPNDTLIGNNTAWYSALCNRYLKEARGLAIQVTASDPSPTYLDTLAEIEYRLGNVAQAIELSEQCRKIEPKDQQHRNQLKRFRAGQP